MVSDKRSMFAVDTRTCTITRIHAHAPALESIDKPSASGVRALPGSSCGRCASSWMRWNWCRCWCWSAPISMNSDALLPQSSATWHMTTSILLPLLVVVPFSVSVSCCNPVTSAPTLAEPRWLEDGPALRPGMLLICVSRMPSSKLLSTTLTLSALTALEVAPG